MLRSLLITALLTAGSLAAADFAGRWAGILDTDGDKVPVYLTILSDAGGKISGFAATGVGTSQAAIEKAEIQGEELFLELRDNANRPAQFRLRRNGDLLTGEATIGGRVSKVTVVPTSGGRGGFGVGSGGGSGSGAAARTESGSGVLRVGNGVTAPVLLRKVEPQYTEEARAAKYQGTVVLYIEVGPDGKARNIRVQRSLGLGLDAKAIEAVEQWDFMPGKKDGVPVTVAATIEVNFRL